MSLDNSKVLSDDKSLDDPETTDIAKISEGPVKIKGTVKAIKLIDAPLTHKKCIGYKYQQLSYIIIRSRDKRFNNTKKWRELYRDSLCENFYVTDASSSVLVNAKNINIATALHKNEKKLPHRIVNIENRLVEDGSTITLIGYAVKAKNGTMTIQSKEPNEFIILEDDLYEFVTEDVSFLKRKFTLFLLYLLAGSFVVMILNYTLQKLGVLQNFEMHLSPVLIISIFSFGSFGIALILSAVCYLIRPIKWLYNILGPISAGMLIATFFNLLILSILLVTTHNILLLPYSGILVTIACCIFTLVYRKKLWNMSIALEKFEN